MTIYDQFDIGKNIDFSGSYTDNIIQRFSGSSITDRKFVGSKAQANLTTSSFSQFELRYSDTISYVYGKKSGRNDNFYTFINNDETIFDSLVPSPVDFHLSNGRSLSIYVDTISGSSVLGIEGYNPSSSIAIGFTNSSQYYTTYQSLDNNNFFFPFESKYSSLLRLKKPSKHLPKTYNCYYTMDHFGTLTGVTASSDIFSGIILYSSMSQFFYTGSIFAFNVDCLNSWASTTIAGRGGNRFLDVADTNSVFYFGGFQQLSVDLIDTYKLYFGTFRKKWTLSSYGTLPDAKDFAWSDTPRHNSLIWWISPKISGWRYGLYSAIPTNTKVIFRRNSFGQPRDMLEQRPFTKFSLSDNTITSSPVVITFVSGTDAYVTSTNDSTLNTRDSGIYRREYTSGKPFADDI